MVSRRRVGGFSWGQYALKPKRRRQSNALVTSLVTFKPKKKQGCSQTVRKAAVFEAATVGSTPAAPAECCFPYHPREQT